MLSSGVFRPCAASNAPLTLHGTDATQEAQTRDCEAHVGGCIRAVVQLQQQLGRLEAELVGWLVAAAALARLLPAPLAAAICLIFIFKLIAACLAMSGAPLCSFACSAVADAGAAAVGCMLPAPRVLPAAGPASQPRSLCLCIAIGAALP